MEPHLGENVNFSSSFDSKDLQEGWIIGVNSAKFPTHPFIVTTNSEQKNLIADFENWKSFFQQNKEHITYVHRKLIASASEKLRSRFEYLVRTFDSSRMVRRRLSYSEELLKTFEGRVLALGLRALCATVLQWLQKVLRFLWSVVIVGLFWIVVGNFVALFTSRFELFKLNSKKTLELEKLARQAHINYLLNEKEDPGSIELERIENQERELKQTASSASNNIVTLAIALTGLVVSILAFAATDIQAKAAKIGLLPKFTISTHQEQSGRNGEMHDDENLYVTNSGGNYSEFRLTDVERLVIEKHKIEPYTENKKTFYLQNYFAGAAYSAGRQDQAVELIGYNNNLKFANLKKEFQKKENELGYYGFLSLERYVRVFYRDAFSELHEQYFRVDIALGSTEIPTSQGREIFEEGMKVAPNVLDFSNLGFDALDKLMGGNPN